MSKKSVWISILMAVAAIMVIGAYAFLSARDDNASAPAGSDDESSVEADDEDLTPEAAFKKLDESYEVMDEETTLYDVVGAEDGRQAKVDGTLVEVYQYESSDAAEKSSLMKSQDEDDGVATYTKGRLVILVHEDEDGGDEITDKIKRVL